MRRGPNMADQKSNTNVVRIDDEQQVDYEKAQQATKMLLEAVGEDPSRSGLVETWRRRVPNAFETLTEGTRPAAKPEIRTFAAENDELIVKTGIRFYSLCEHHILPFYGHVHVAYRPDGRVVGLSKLARFVRWKSRQLSVQEELTREIADGLDEELNPRCILVQMSATHMCEAMRGVERKSTTHTSASAGDPSERDRDAFNNAVNQW